jgi:hypothetical protein
VEGPHEVITTMGPHALVVTMGPTIVPLVASEDVEERENESAEAPPGAL